MNGFIPLGDQVATSSGSIAAKLEGVSTIFMYILVRCASPHYVCFSRKVLPLEPNIVVIGPPPESDNNVDSVVLETPEPDADGKCIFCNQGE